LVDHPERVEVHEVDAEETVVIEVRVAPDDIGKVIGKEGRTIKAMRTLLHAAAIKTGRKVQLEILE
jgi:hypothetical protein